MREDACVRTCQPDYIWSEKLKDLSIADVEYRFPTEWVLWKSTPKSRCRKLSGVIGKTATAGLDVVRSGRPIFDDFFQHLWPYIGNNTANVVFQMVKRL
ncbi:hypothetical protein TNCV_4597631 [Trichonephila clavipes]|nr:hypothetical protein TNCV_4597631 [Trichonephila clavipes]